MVNTMTGPDGGCCRGGGCGGGDSGGALGWATATLVAGRAAGALGRVTKSGMGLVPVGCREPGRAAAIRKNVRRPARDRLLLPCAWPARPWVRGVGPPVAKLAVAGRLGVRGSISPSTFDRRLHPL